MQAYSVNITRLHDDAQAITTVYANGFAIYKGVPDFGTYEAVYFTPHGDGHDTLKTVFSDCAIRKRDYGYFSLGLYGRDFFMIGQSEDTLTSLHTSTVQKGKDYLSCLDDTALRLLNF